MLNIERKAALEAKEFCRDCHKFCTWDECENCYNPLCEDCQLLYEGKTRCHKCHTAVIADDGHIDDCPAWAGEPCKCWVYAEEL